MKRDLSVFADALRDCLGLAPLYDVRGDRPYVYRTVEERERERFGQSRVWPLDRVRTPMRGGTW